MLREGARLLVELVTRIHAVNNKNGVVVEALVSAEIFDRLCLWRSQCQDCESNEAVEIDEDLNESELVIA